MTRAQLVKKINKAICGKAPGFFKDDCWHGKQIVEDALFAIPGTEIKSWDSQYRQDEAGTPIGKTWNYTLSDGQHLVYVIVIASGAGTVTDPLSKYDIIAYAS